MLLRDPFSTMRLTQVITNSNVAVFIYLFKIIRFSVVISQILNEGETGMTEFSV